MNLNASLISSVNINSGDSMKKKLIIVLIIFVLVLVTGCNNNEGKNKNQKILTCSKTNASTIELQKNIPYITDYNNTFIYSNGVLKSAEMKETYDFSNYLHSRSLNRSDYVNLYKILYDAFECSTDYYSNVESLSGSVKECNKEWEDDAFSRVYTFDVNVLKDRDDFKTLKKAKDFHEKSLFKCSIK